jgi:hypothetical protein
VTGDQRVKHARKILAAYDQGKWTDPVNVTGHLAAAARMLLEVIDGHAARPVTAASPAGQVTLSPADTLTVLGALRDGARWNDYPPGDPAAAARYRSLARSLGEDR